MSEELYNTILQRKSVRDFLDKPVEPEKRQKIYDAIVAAPTTENMMMYTVISVDDPDTRARLSRQPAMKKAPMVLVFCADYRRWAHLFDGQTESNRRPGIGEYQLAVIDATIAAENAVLAAESLGLSSVYLGDIMEHFEDRAAALGLPDGVAPVVSLCIGYATPAQAERAPVRRYPQNMVIHSEKYHDFTRDELLTMVQERSSLPDREAATAWVQKFARRAVEGKGAAERTRSLETVLQSWKDITF